MVVHLVAVGRVKNAAFRSACEEYEKRVGRYLKLVVKEVRDGGRRDRDAADALRLEGEAILDAASTGSALVALTRTGRGMSTAEFAEYVGRCRNQARDVTFVIGGAHGLHQSVLGAADHLLSLSPMTLPHELARLTLLEQLYRACTILRGEPYHKGGRVR